MRGFLGYPGRPGRFFDDLPGIRLFSGPERVYLGPNDFQDKAGVLAAVEQDGMALQFASEALRDDKEVESLVSQVDPVRAGQFLDP